MTPHEITDRLDKALRGTDFLGVCYELTGSWENRSPTVDCVDPILEFMEINSDLDFGAPGPLVHFVESFFGHGYEERLLTSVRRRPTTHTTWMLHRLINGTKDNQARFEYLKALAEIAVHVDVSDRLRSMAREWLDEQEWEELASTEFGVGYADSDAAYDEPSSR